MPKAKSKGIEHQPNKRPIVHCLNTGEVDCDFCTIPSEYIVWRRIISLNKAF